MEAGVPFHRNRRVHLSEETWEEVERVQNEVEKVGLGSITWGFAGKGERSKSHSGFDRMPLVGLKQENDMTRFTL